MDAAVELAKCRETAAALVPTFAELGTGTIEDRITTALMEARADALRESDLPYLAEFGPGETYRLAEELMVEVRARRARGL